MVLSTLRFIDYAITVVACGITLFLAFPAYRRTKQIGFLLWCFSALGALWNTVTLHALGMDPRTNPAGYVFTHYSYRILFVVDGILSIIGTVLIIKGYLLLFESRQHNGADSKSTHVV